MAQYRVKQRKDGKIQVWARYTPFKGAATKSKVFTGDPDALAEVALQAGEWVKKQRLGRQLPRD